MNQDQYNELNELAQKHYDEDMLVRGTFGGTPRALNFQGCSLGCFSNEISIKNDDFNYVRAKREHISDYFGYHVWVAHMQEYLFEENGKKTHVNIAKAIPIDFDDWDRVGGHFINQIIKKLFRNVPTDNKFYDFIQLATGYNILDKRIKKQFYSYVFEDLKSIKLENHDDVRLKSILGDMIDLDIDDYDAHLRCLLRLDNYNYHNDSIPNFWMNVEEFFINSLSMAKNIDTNSNSFTSINTNSINFSEN